MNYPNETIATIMTRRSIRAFEKKQVEEEKLQTVINAGLYAPSAMNQQPWHFVVIQKPELLSKIEEACSDFKRREFAFYHAPTLIVVFARKEGIAPIADGSLAIGNMVNAAASLGLGTCWINAVNPLFASEAGQALRKEIFPDMDYISVGSIVVGYPDCQNPEPSPRAEGTVSYIR